MVTLTTDQVVKQMLEHDLPYYTVLDGKSVLDSQHDDKKTVADSISQLQEFLKMCSGNNVTIKVGSRSNFEINKGGGTGKKYEYRINLNNNSANDNSRVLSGINNNNVTSTERDLLLRIGVLESEKKELEFNNKLDIINAKMELLQKEKTNPLEPFAIGALNKLFGESQEQPIATGAANSLSGVSTEDTKVRMSEALKLFMKLDNEYLLTLEKIVKIAGEKPDEYNQFKKMI